MKRNYLPIVSALLIAAGIFFLGVFIKSGIDNIAFRDRQVTVKGLAEREVQANRVTWPIQFSVAGDDLLSLYDQVTKYNDKIVKFLTTNGIDKNEISINPPDTYNATTNQYSSGNFRYNYSLTCNVTVTTSKVDKVRQLINRQGELLSKGIAIVSNDYSNQISYEYTGLNENQARDDSRSHRKRP